MNSQDILLLITVAGSVAAATAYIGAKFDRLAERLTGVQLEAKEHVTFRHCHERRENCPIVTELRAIQHQLREDPEDDD